MSILSVVIFFLIFSKCNGVNSHTFRAAVVDYEPIRTNEVTLESTLENAYVLAKYAMEARWEDVDILVFPEGGLTGLIGPDRKQYQSYAQEIPDPNVHTWNPCDEPDRFPNTKVLQVLSCASKYNALIIVANLIATEKCDITKTDCPADGHFYYNANVIFQKNGTLAGRYYKRHLFLEPGINPSTETDYTIVDVGFTKIACVICFDIVHKEPTITLIKEKGVKTLIFPTDGRLGSGIFTSGKGVLNQTFDLSSPGKMLIADLPLNPQELSSGDLACDDDTHYDHSEEVGAVHPPLILIDPVTKTHLPSSQTTEKMHMMFNLHLKDFNFFFLDSKNMDGHVDLCKNDFCCHLDYSFLHKDDTVYAFSVNDGSIKFYDDVYEVQICTVLRCESVDPTSCGRLPEEETTSSFKQLKIEGTFDTDVVLPQMFATNLQLIPGNEWSFHSIPCYDQDGGDITTAKVELTSPAKQPIMVAALIGRLYGRN